MTRVPHAFIMDLVWRDPYTRRLLRAAHPYRFESGSEEARKAWEFYHKHRDRLRLRWGADVRLLPPDPMSPEAPRYFDDFLRGLANKPVWSREEYEAYMVTMFRRGAPAVDILLLYESPVRFTVNNGCASVELLSKISRDLEAIGWKEGYSYHYHSLACLAPGEAPSKERPGEHTIPCETRRGADPNTANSLTMTVSLDDVPHDLSGLAKAFVALVRAARRHRGTRGASVKDDSEAIMRHLSPEARRRHGPYLKAKWRRRRIIAGWHQFVAPLRRVSERTFRRDLDHYDMFMQQPGTTIRGVASCCRAHGRRCDEDAVRRGVRLVYEAIHRRRFDPRKIRRETNAPRVPAPEDLAAWRHFARTIEPDWKGRLRGEVSYSDAQYGVPGGEDDAPSVSISPRRRPRRRGSH